MEDTVSPKPDIFEICVKRAWDEHVVPLQSRIAELEKDNEALARNLAELQVMYGEVKARLNAANEYLERNGLPTF